MFTSPLSPVLLLTLLLAGLLSYLLLVYLSLRILRSSGRWHGRHARTLNDLSGNLGKIEHRMAVPMVDWEGQMTSQHWVIVSTCSRRASLSRILEDIRRHEPEARILVVDNGSTDDTALFLAQQTQQGRIQRTLLNQVGTVPQWQKCHGLQQALRVLALERPSHVTWLDDDLVIKGPWVQDSIRLLTALAARHVEVVCLLTDEVQRGNHPPTESLQIDGLSVDLAGSFSGAFVFVAADFFRRYGLPPVNEGISNASVEDWYYSRLIRANGGQCAFLDRSTHPAYERSLREQAEKQSGVA